MAVPNEVTWVVRGLSDPSIAAPIGIDLTKLQPEVYASYAKCSELMKYLESLSDARQYRNHKVYDPAMRLLSSILAHTNYQVSTETFQHITFAFPYCTGDGKEVLADIIYDSFLKDHSRIIDARSDAIFCNGLMQFYGHLQTQHKSVRIESFARLFPVILSKDIYFPPGGTQFVVKSLFQTVKVPQLTETSAAHIMQSLANVFADPARLDAFFEDFQGQQEIFQYIRIRGPEEVIDLDPKLVLSLTNVMVSLMGSTPQRTKIVMQHSGFLNFVVAVMKRLPNTVLPEVWPGIFRGLSLVAEQCTDYTIDFLRYNPGILVRTKSLAVKEPHKTGLAATHAITSMFLHGDYAQRMFLADHGLVEIVASGAKRFDQEVEELADMISVLASLLDDTHSLDVDLRYRGTVATAIAHEEIEKLVMEIFSRSETGSRVSMVCENFLRIAGNLQSETHRGCHTPLGFDLEN